MNLFARKSGEDCSAKYTTTCNMNWERETEILFDKSVLDYLNHSLKTMTFHIDEFLKEISLQKSYDKVFLNQQEKENKRIEKIKLFMKQVKNNDI